MVSNRSDGYIKFTPEDVDRSMETGKFKIDNPLERELIKGTRTYKDMIEAFEDQKNNFPMLRSFGFVPNWEAKKSGNSEALTTEWNKMMHNGLSVFGLTEAPSILKTLIENVRPWMNNIADAYRKIEAGDPNTDREHAEKELALASDHIFCQILNDEKYAFAFAEYDRICHSQEEEIIIAPSEQSLIDFSQFKHPVEEFMQKYGYYSFLSSYTLCDHTIALAVTSQLLDRSRDHLKYLAVAACSPDEIEQYDLKEFYQQNKGKISNLKIAIGNVHQNILYPLAKNELFDSGELRFPLFVMRREEDYWKRLATLEVSIVTSYKALTELLQDDVPNKHDEIDRICAEMYYSTQKDLLYEKAFDNIANVYRSKPVEHLATYQFSKERGPQNVTSHTIWDVILSHGFAKINSFPNLRKELKELKAARKEHVAEELRHMVTEEMYRQRGTSINNTSHGYRNNNRYQNRDYRDNRGMGGYNGGNRGGYYGDNHGIIDDNGYFDKDKNDGDQY